ncbi:hypothetical protein SLNWT_3538 [Streptomyces albus]|uniref:Uncharacterized protein n=1 Tax=Streptomyces albus (strain ATCC 21838 / DSM 41398 / FERM P-419 / JCM 4703 / NBRC 107858) TaxID=1081613 RepID=A0A0B5EQP5_STRA4|nr:hypothetical protein SLNWT_3538 [Streptomyces albus]AOU78218.1 hypothetical protein SLNHY_3527 [Streptomyces albus]AYN33970.1 hypothetical protein DUI70_3470 [Streptomyces albus]
MGPVPVHRRSSSLRVSGVCPGFGWFRSFRRLVVPGAGSRFVRRWSRCPDPAAGGARRSRETRQGYRPRRPRFPVRTGPPGPRSRWRLSGASS